VGVGRLPPVVPDDDSLFTHPDDPAVLGEHAIVDAPGLRGVRVPALGLGRHPGAVVRVDRPVVEIRVAGFPLAGRVAEEHLDLRADVEGTPISRQFHDVSGDRQVLDERAVERLGCGSAARTGWSDSLAVRRLGIVVDRRPTRLRASDRSA